MSQSLADRLIAEQQQCIELMSKLYPNMDNLLVSYIAVNHKLGGFILKRLLELDNGSMVPALAQEPAPTTRKRKEG
jgi:hypothetical protein